MDEIKIGNLVLAALYGLPGYVFILILTRYSFKTARTGAGKTVQLLAAFLFSTVFICLFDPEKFVQFLLTTFWERQPYDVPTEWEMWITTLPYPKDILNTFFSGKAPPDSNILVSYLMWFTAFAAACAILLSTGLTITTWYLRASLDNFIIGGFHFFHYVGKRSARLFSKTENNIALVFHNLKIKKNIQFFSQNIIFKKLARAFDIYSTIMTGIFFVTFIILVIAAVIIGLTLLLIISLLHFLAQVIVFFYYRGMSLFKHPAEEVFEHTFQTRSAIPIIEIYTKNEKINKGVYASILPKNSEEISSFTIKNVIQYTKQNQTDFFDRETRSVYVFPNQESCLTVNSESINDINMTYMKFTDFRWNFKITGPDSILNQSWYLKLILNKHKSLFDFERFNAWVDSRYAPHFFLEVLRLLDESYSSFIYSYKLKSLTFNLLSYWKPYKKDLKARYSTLTPDEKNDVNEARAAFASYLRQMRIRFNKLR